MFYAMFTSLYIFVIVLTCFDTVGWASERASGP